MTSLKTGVYLLIGFAVGALGAVALIGSTQCREMTLDAGWAGVLGASIGVLGALATNYLTHSLQNDRANTLVEKRRNRLRRELEDKRYTWRSIERLSAVVGADEETTIGLLLEIDARAERANAKLWALESRAPYPEENEIKG